nr:quorum sensing histidine kinase QseC [Erwinia sp. E602]
MMPHSLRLRLMLGFLLLSLLCWGAAAVGTWWQTRHNINQLFDTQQMLFAKRLTTLQQQPVADAGPLPKSKKMLRHHRGEQDDDALAFAVFSRDGRMLLNDGDNGRNFLWHPGQDGFSDGQLRGDDDRWRLLWLTSADGQSRVVVGQEWEYREDMTRDLVQASLLPWLLALPVMLLLMLWLVSHQLSPLKRLTHQLRQRAADDAAPLADNGVPAEVRPLLQALNQLFARISQTLLRERRFTSDAAHELRSPLAALKVQTEVAQLAHDDTAMRQHALVNLDHGIDRATRLVDQLLVLSRLDDGQPPEVAMLDLTDLLRQAIVEQDALAQAGKVELRLEAPDTLHFRGNPLLLALLLRNLLHNAIRYTPPGGEVVLRLQPGRLVVADNGPGVDPALLPRLGERFYRPPGQALSGSGLGLSIVQRIARLHGIRVQLSNGDEGGLRVTLAW